MTDTMQEQAASVSLNMAKSIDDLVRSALPIDAVLADVSCVNDEEGGALYLYKSKPVIYISPLEFSPTMSPGGCYKMAVARKYRIISPL
jgi:hypothetical protein